jgi:hypothetical protein
LELNDIDEALAYAQRLYCVAAAMRGNITAREILLLPPGLQDAIGKLDPRPIASFEEWLPLLTPAEPGGET